MIDAASARVTWIGHGTVIVETPGASVIVDPVLGSRVAHLRRRTPLDRSTLPDLDAVLVTHAHHDHLDIRSLRSLPDSTPKYAPRIADEVMRKRGVHSVRSVTVGTVVEIGDVSIETIRVWHSGSRLFPSRAGIAVGFVLRSAHGPSILVAGDTALHADMADIAPVDVAVLPVGGWWRGVPDDDHLDADKAFRAAQLIGARIIIPIHWGTLHPIFLRRFMDPIWAQMLVRLTSLSDAANGIDVRLLQPGGQTIVHAE
ncbi:MAG: MBL fold metallo-hydrolase [Gaiellales bacterium]